MLMIINQAVGAQGDREGTKPEGGGSQVPGESHRGFPPTIPESDNDEDVEDEDEGEGAGKPEHERVEREGGLNNK